jgi:fumarylpyruvate hydrolase
MAEFVIPAPTPASVAVQSNPARFPVRRIFCVGRNYAEHAREFGNDPDKEPPFFFTKPADAVIDDGFTLPYPSATANLHFEGELVVAIGKGGANIPEASALSHVWGYAPGNDLTRRDLQSEAKTMKRPWDMSKGFDRSAPCGALVPVATAGHPPADAVLTCTVNGAVKQKAKLSDMIWSVPAIIAFLSQQVELHPGDLIYTGTPAGVGALQRGDSCEVSITGLGSVTTSIA